MRVLLGLVFVAMWVLFISAQSDEFAKFCEQTRARWLVLAAEWTGMGMADDAARCLTQADRLRRRADTHHRLGAAWRAAQRLVDTVKRMGPTP